MKRFFVFACSRYYPNGGMADFKQDFDTHEEAKIFQESLQLTEKEYYGKGFEKGKFEFTQIFDSVENKTRYYTYDRESDDPDDII